MNPGKLQRIRQLITTFFLDSKVGMFTIGLLTTIIIVVALGDPWWMVLLIMAFFVAAYFLSFILPPYKKSDRDETRR